MNVLLISSKTSFRSRNMIHAIKSINKDANIYFLDNHLLYGVNENKLEDIEEFDINIHIKNKYLLKICWIIIKILMTLGYYPFKKKNVATLEGILIKYDIDYVLLSWGNTILPYLYYLSKIKKLNKKYKIIFNILNFPSRSTKLIEILERRNFKKLLPFTNYVILPTSEMDQYFVEHNMIPSHVIKYIQPEFFIKTQKMEYLDIDEGRNEVPRIIYLGRTTFAWHNFLDDIRKQINEITNNDIKLYAQKSSLFQELQYRLNNNNLVLFEKFPLSSLNDADLSNYVERFDAVLVTYNVNSQNTRFNLSLPDRFLYALRSSTPIILPKGRYLAMEAFIEKYDIGYVYKDLDGLNLFLNDKNLLRSKRDNLRILSEKEFNFNKSIDILKNILENKI